jgi:hypothetical protein
MQQVRRKVDFPRIGVPGFVAQGKNRHAGTICPVARIGSSVK